MKQTKLQTIIDRGVNNGYDADDLDLVSSNPLSSEDPRRVLFNHDFARCYWGEDLRQMFAYDALSKEEIESLGDHRGWQYHLQQCVISEDPIQYYLDNYQAHE